MAKIVAYLGLGTMGGAMTNNLLKAGFVVHGYDPSPEARARAEEAGAKTFDSPAEAASEAEVICSSVPETKDVHETYLGEKGALLTSKDGVVCFDFSTIAPSGSQDIAQQAAEKGAIFLDTPVSGSAPSAISAELNVMVGGDEAAMNAHRDVLEAVSESVNYFGPNGAGLHMKLVANQIVSVFFSVVSEGLTLGERSGLDPVEMMEYLKNASIPKILGIKGSALASRDYTPFFRIDLMCKDLRLISEMAEAATTPTPFAALARQVYIATSAMGFGDVDQNAVREFFDKTAGLSA